MRCREYGAYPPRRTDRSGECRLCADTRFSSVVCRLGVNSASVPHRRAAHCFMAISQSELGKPEKGSPSSHPVTCDGVFLYYYWLTGNPIKKLDPLPSPSDSAQTSSRDNI